MPRARAGHFLRDRRDRLPLALAAAHGTALACFPSWWVVALGLWWNANTVSHHAVHRRLFHRPVADALASAGLTLLLGIPQRLWQERHLAHHAGRRWQWRHSRRLWGEIALLALGYAWLGAAAPQLLLGAWVPGVALGLGLCAVHGHFEHHGGTTNCHARWWNLLFLNDGFHVEHHARPRAHFRDLPRQARAGARSSPLPPVLRVLGLPWLDLLERAVLRSPPLQTLVLAAHRTALRRLIRAHPADFAAVRSVIVVGGGLFPRSALLLRELLPAARIVVLDRAPAHLHLAARRLPPLVEVRCGTFTPGQTLDCDLAVLPLALAGDRGRCYASPPAPLTLVHDWGWRRTGAGARVPWLAKRINLARGGARRIASIHPDLEAVSA